MSEEYFKIKIEQDVLNNIVDSGKITLDEKYYHKRSIRLMKEAQEWGKQQALKNILELIINFKNKLHKDEYKVWDERRVLSMLEQIERELAGVEELNKDAEIFGLGNALKDYKKENRKLKKELAGEKE